MENHILFDQIKSIKYNNIEEYYLDSNNIILSVNYIISSSREIIILSNFPTLLNNTTYQYL